MTYSVGMGMLRDVANTGGELITSTLGSGSATPKAANVLCAPACPTHPPPRQTSTRNNRNSNAPHSSPKPKLYLTLGPCVHHGPDSKHATCECRDPTLSRRKKRKPKQNNATTETENRATDTVAAASPVPTSPGPLFSPVFVTRISRAAAKFPRASFEPARRHRQHLHHNFHHSRSSTFDIDRVPSRVCDACIRTYTHPIAGNCVRGQPLRVPVAPIPRRRSRRSRRNHRRRSNRRTNYPSGVFNPVHPRVPRPFDVYNPSSCLLYTSPSPRD